MNEIEYVDRKITIDSDSHEYAGIENETYKAIVFYFLPNMDCNPFK